jgi:hypothetical protein
MKVSLMLRWIFACFGLCSTLASAEPRPWANGVSEANQARALELFRDGNAALKESLFVKAAQIYREALTFWDHPAVHYNLGLALVNLDQPVETREHLVKALAFGEGPLDNDKFEQAKRYKSLVEKQLTTLRVTCAVDGASVKLDGQVLFTGPGKYEGAIRSGSHTMLATRDEYVPSEINLRLTGGDEKNLDLKMLSRAETIEYRRQFSEWIPWVVGGAGLAVAGAGVGLHFVAQDQFRQYDRQIAQCVDISTGGCTLNPKVASVKSVGDALQASAIAAYSLGGAAFATGLALLYVNRLKPYEKSVVVKTEFSVAPLLLSGGAGAFVSVNF